MTTVWGAKSGKVLMPWSIRPTRREVIRGLEKNLGPPWGVLWKRAVAKLEVREAK